MHLIDPNYDRQGNAMVIGLTTYALSSFIYIAFQKQVRVSLKSNFSRLKHHIQSENFEQ